MAIQNVRLATEVQPLTRRDFTVAQSLVDPNSSAPPLLDGEFLGITSAYDLAREGAANALNGGVSSGAASAANHVSETPWYMVWMEQGRYDAQAISKTTVLWGAFEADFHSDVLRSGESFSLGDAVYVNWLADTPTTTARRRGLTKVRNGSDGRPHGYVTRVYTSGTYAIRVVILSPGS